MHWPEARNASGRSAAKLQQLISPDVDQRL
jgi:hypothetical protein